MTDVKPERVTGYRVISELARSSTTAVFHARDARGRNVALKIHERGAGEVAGLAELSLLGLSHPGIAACLDAGRLPGDLRLFTVTELVTGTPLGSRALAGPAERGQAIALVARLLSALALVHESGILHRDLKDDNVRLRPDGESPVILDFGLCCPAAESGRRPAAGTPRAMAPELFRGEPASVATDLWAGGLLLAETLLGRQLFTAQEPQAMADEREAFAGLTAADARRLGEPALVALLERLLAPVPARRPADCRAALAALPALPEGLSRSLGEQTLVARWSAALARHDPRRASRIAALSAGRLWIPAFDSPQTTLDEAAGVFAAVAATLDRPQPRIAARLAALTASTVVRPIDVALLAEALAEHAPLTLETGRTRAAGGPEAAPRDELARLLAESRGVELFDEPLLQPAECAAALQDWVGRRPVLERHLLAAPPADRQELAEAFAALMRSGAVRLGDEGLQLDEAAQPPGWPLPPVAEAELPRDLPADAHEALSLLSVCPRPLETGPLQGALGRPVAGTLGDLVARGLVRRETGEPRDRFAPVDARVRRAAVASAPPAAPARAALALALTASVGGTLDEEAAADVAVILGDAAPERPDDDGLGALAVEGADVLRRAGRLERGIALLRRGLAGSVPGGPLRRRMHLDLADLLLRRNDYEAALAALAVARSELPQDGALRVREARALFRRGRFPEALAALEQLDPDELPREDLLLGLQVRSQVNQAAGRLDEALADVREALRRHGGEPDRRLFTLLERAASIEARLGRLDEAVRLNEQCISLMRRMGQDLLTGSPLVNMGRAVFARGEKRRGLQILESGIARLEQAGDLGGLANACNSAGAAWLGLGRLDTARRHLARALQLSRRLDDQTLAGMVLNNTGRVLAAEGRLPEADESFEESLRLRTSRGDRVGRVAVLLTRGPLRVGRGRLADARADLAIACEELARLSAPDWSIVADLLQASLLLAEGRPAEATAPAQSALVSARGHGLTREELQARDLLARAGGGDLEDLDAERLERGPWLADLLFTRAAAREGAGRGPAADADCALALAILGESPDGPIEARGLLLRVGADLDRLGGVLSTASPDYGKVGELLSRVARDLDRARVLVDMHDLSPLRPRLADLRSRLEQAGDGDDMSGLAALSERLRNLERLAEINKALNTERDTQRLLELIVDSAIELTGAARGFLILFDGRAEEFRAARHIDESTIHNPEFEVSHSVARRVVKEGRAIVTANAIDDPRFATAASISELKLLSILCVPLVSRDRTLGAIYLDHPQVVGRFDERHLGTVTALAEQAAIALENARLSEGLASTNRELRGSREEIARLNEALQARLDRQQAELETVKESLDASRRALALRYDYSNIITRSPRMHAVLDLMDRITDTEFPVIIQGESGTGKELIARALHFNGPRREMNFLSLNCAAIAEPLIESELFGHVRGAFTGADRDRKGLFDQAHGGTLFLDEIGDMSLSVQKRLLRVLQEGEFLPVGGREVRKVDVRILCATHRDLRQMVAEKSFREDLYYRMAVAFIQVPPLRDRTEDLPLLLEHFMERHGGTARDIEPEALALLAAQPWPGNVREFENLAMNLLLFDRDGTHVRAALVRRLLGAGAAGSEEPDVEDAGSAGAGSESGSLKQRLVDFERHQVEAALVRAGGNKAQAARDLGVGIRTLYKILARLGL